MTYCIGPDMSYHQDDNATIQQIAWDVTKDAGCDFCFIRGMFNLQVDEDWDFNWNHAKQETLLRGAYHFVNYTSDPVRQAQAFVRLLDEDKGELPPVLDFEYYHRFGDISHAHALNFIEAYMDIVDVALDVNTMIYTNPNWLLYRLRPTPIWLLKHPLWVAHWGPLQQPITGDWHNWTFWQWTNTANGPYYGAESNAVDMNRFNGDTKALYERFNIEWISPDPQVSPLDERVTNIENWIRREL